MNQEQWLSSVSGHQATPFTPLRDNDELRKLIKKMKRRYWFVNHLPRNVQQRLALRQVTR